MRAPREYEWTVTELKFPGVSQIGLTTIWGSSPTNLYVSGFSSAGGGGVYHFDGRTWNHIPFSGEFNFFHEILGFGPNDVWIAGERTYFSSPQEPIRDSAVVFRFNGSTWAQVLPSHMGARSLYSIWGTSSQNIYCGSNDGKILHYDGFQWTVDTIYPGTLSINTIGGDESVQFAFGNTWVGNVDDSVMWFQRTAGLWERKFIQLWSGFTIYPGFGLQAFYSPNPGTYWSCTFKAIFQFGGKGWQRIFSDDEAVFFSVHGSGSSNVFGVGRKAGRAMMYHYDGDNWKEITSIGSLLPDRVDLRDVWVFENQVFAVGTNISASYIIHGK